MVLNNLLFDSKYAGRLCMTADLGGKTAIGTDRTTFCPTSPFLPNRGYFITPRLNSAQITDHYNLFTLKFKPLGVDEKIRIKYKTTDRKDYPKVSNKFNDTSKWIGTWTSSSVFTSTQDLSDAVAGDEVEITAGVGSGHLAHISTITESAGTYTVTLDEAFSFAVASDQMYFIVDNWTYLTEIDSTNTLHYYTAQIGSDGKFIQFKVEMRGVGVTIEELQVDNRFLLPNNR